MRPPVGGTPPYGDSPAGGGAAATVQSARPIQASAALFMVSPSVWGREYRRRRAVHRKRPHRLRQAGGTGPGLPLPAARPQCYRAGRRIEPMQKTRRLAAVLAALPLAGVTAAGAEGEGPQITVYNQDFALVRQVRRLHLKEGDNELRIGGLTALLEPDSVVLRDLQDTRGLRVLEQRYAGDTLSQGFLLRQHEGKVLAFQTVNPATGRKEVVSGRVIRSGYAPQGSAATGGTTPIIEVDGKLQFSLPGEPLFDGPGPDALLQPLLLWNLWSDRAGERDFELSFITGGLGWRATYNAVTSEKSARFDLVGWISLINNSGGEFKDARVKLMAGEVNRTQPLQARALMLESAVAEVPPRPPQVTEKALDEYHLYTLPRPVTLLNGENLQVEFCRGSDLPAERLYVYDGSQMNVYTG